MNCDICEEPIQPDSVHKITLHKKEFTLCGWDAQRVLQFIENNITHHSINIYWGVGHICWSTWGSLRVLIRQHNIKEILEIGTGLSTELFYNEGLKIVTMDSCKPHIELYKKLLSMKEQVDFHYYPDSDHLPDLDKLYPGKKWDFVFVDSPHERSREVKLAMKYSTKFIYLHDPNLGEQSFFRMSCGDRLKKKRKQRYLKG